MINSFYLIGKMKGSVTFEQVGIYQKEFIFIETLFKSEPSLFVVHGYNRHDCKKFIPTTHAHNNHINTYIT